MLLRLALLITLVPLASSQCFEFSDVPPPNSQEYLGVALGLEGTTVLVGAPDKLSGGFDRSGIVRLYDAPSGASLGKLKPLDPENTKNFGVSIATGNGLAVVGAPIDGGPSSATGALYLFDIATKSQLFKMTAPIPHPGARLGDACALDSQWVIGGAPFDDGNGSQSGAAYVFDSASGAFLHELTASIQAGDQFGHAIAAGGGLAVVSAPLADLSGVDSGRVFVFDLATGSLLRELQPSGLGAGDLFGWSVSVDGGRAAVSQGWGRVVLFDLATGGTLATYDLPAEVHNGAVSAVSLEGNRLLVGQAIEGGALGKNLTGRAALIDVNSGDLVAMLADFDGQLGDLYGNAVLVRGGYLLAGAPSKDGGLADQGGVFVYSQCSGTGTTYCSPGVPNSTGSPGQLAAFGSDVVSEDNLVLRALDLPPGRFGMLLVSDTQTFIPGAGGSQGNLCLGGTLARYTSFLAQVSDWGSLEVPVELTALPFNPPHAVQAGETWNFQLWHRDKPPTGGSNFTDAVSILFQ